MARRRFDPLTVFGVPLQGGGLIPILGQQWFVDPNADVFVPKKAWGTGKSDLNPFRTLEEALAAANTHDRIFVTGNVREEGLIASNLKFDVHVVGVGGLHHPDQPSAAYHPGAAMIRPPAAPTADTDLITVRGRGWQFHNIMFDCPVDAAAVKLVNNGGAGVSEYDASHAIFDGCSFLQGKTAIEVDGPIGNVKVLNSEFGLLSEAGGCAIFAPTDGGPNFRWKIRNNFFVPAATTEGNKGNQEHIDLALFSSLIEGNFFGTVEATGHYIDLSGGQDNMVVDNYLMGAYAHADYQDAPGDLWINYTEAGLTSANPAA
ncbi:MAG: hypothetical protein AB7Q29_16025 [Vicinamibacterales bacterium]